MRIDSFITVAKSLWTNFRGCHALPVIKRMAVGKSIHVDYLRWKDIFLARKEHLKVFHEPMSAGQFLLLLFFRRKLSFVLKNSKGESIAYMLLYFNANELKCNCIHIGALYMAEKFQGTGRAALLEKTVLTYLQEETKVSEVRARVTIENEDAYTLVLGNGFVVLEEYEDKGIKKKRAYVAKKINRDGDK